MTKAELIALYNRIALRVTMNSDYWESHRIHLAKLINRKYKRRIIAL